MTHPSEPTASMLAESPRRAVNWGMVARMSAFFAWLLPPSMLVLGALLDKVIGPLNSSGGEQLLSWPGWGLLMMPAAFLLACICVVTSCICIWFARHSMTRVMVLMMMVMNFAWLSLVGSLALIF